VRLDHEAIELLRHDPELLAIADAIASTSFAGRKEPPARRWASPRRLARRSQARLERRGRD